MADGVQDDETSSGDRAVLAVILGLLALEGLFILASLIWL